jgi:AcrR family transcriptional regulator
MMSAMEEQVPRAGFRERLLAGLAESIREKGLQRTQISDIVRHARTSRRTFYECFADKESCFVELVEVANRAILEEVRVAVDPHAAWAEQVDQAIDSYLEALAREPSLTVTISRELPTLGTRGAQLLHDSIERYAELIVALVSASDEGTSITVEEAIMLAGGVAELLGRAVTRGDDVRTVGPAAKSVIKAVLDPSRTR